MSRRSGSNRRGRRRSGNRERYEKRSTVADAIQLTCTYCGKPIRHPQMAMVSPENGEPIHFDCVISKLAENEELGPKEKICYLGQGTFGIIKFKSGSNNRDFIIKKRIPYESGDKPAQWRKQMREQLESAW